MSVPPHPRIRELPELAESVTRPPLQRLVVIASDFRQFADWCRDHRVSVREPRLLYLTERNLWQLQAATDIRYVLLDWPLHWSRAQSDVVRRQLHARGGTQVTPEELEAWERSITERTTR